MAGTFKAQIIDDFLPEPLLAELTKYALSPDRVFAPSSVRNDDGTDQPVASKRKSLICMDGLGDLEEAFLGVFLQHEDTLMASIGIPEFTVSYRECELVVHGDGDFFRTHIDTLNDRGQAADSDRMMSAVYFFHREPKQFSGGELVIYPLSPQLPPQRVSPMSNRLVVFPAFAPHEVLKIECPSGLMADLRFTINCWLYRSRA